MNSLYTGAKSIKKYIESIFDKKCYSIRFGQEYNEKYDEDLTQLYMIYEHIENMDKPDLVLYDGKYYGQMHNGKRDGEGVMKYFDGNEYIGYWKNNERSGMGIMKWDENETFDLETAMTTPKIYIGNFENNHMHGKGKLLYNNGCAYIGNFENGCKNGYGLLFNRDMHMIGKWVNNEFKQGFIYKQQLSHFHVHGRPTYLTIAKYLFKGKIRYAPFETNFVFYNDVMEYHI